MHRRRFLATLGTTAAFSAFGALPLGAAEIILTLSGSSGNNRGGGTVASSLAQLDALPQTSFATSTPWHKNSLEFSGVSLKDYFASHHIEPKTIRLVALNDYSVDADVATLLKGDALLATHQGGKPIPISDKGPVFLVFPFDARPELQHQTYYSRAVWQLTTIEVIA